MSEVKALEKLRGLRDETASKIVDNPKWVCKRAEEIADEIEAEIAERFMELPVDADGIPIRVGDYLQLGDTRGDVVALTYCPSDGKLPWEWQCDTGDWHKTAFARHANPRTVEDVLREIVSMTDQPLCEEDILAFADEIRAMFGEVDE